MFTVKQRTKAARLISTALVAAATGVGQLLGDPVGSENRQARVSTYSMPKRSDYKNYKPKRKRKPTIDQIAKKIRREVYRQMNYDKCIANNTCLTN